MVLAAVILFAQILALAYALRAEKTEHRELSRSTAENVLTLSQGLFEQNQGYLNSTLQTTLVTVVERLANVDYFAAHSTDGQINYQSNLNHQSARVPTWFKRFVNFPASKLSYQSQLLTGATLSIDVSISSRAFYESAWQSLRFHGALLLFSAFAMVFLARFTRPAMLFKATLNPGETENSGQETLPARQWGKNLVSPGMKSLSSEEQRYSTLFETLPLGVFEFKPKDKRFFINSELRRMLKLSDSMVNIYDIENLVHPADLESVRRSFFRAASEGNTVITGSYRYCLLDGSIIWAKLRLTPTLDESGDAISLVGGVLDVTAEHEQLSRIKMLSTMFETISRVNYLVVAAQSENELLQEIPEALAQVPGFDQVLFFPIDKNKHNTPWTFGEMGSHSGNFSDEKLRDTARALREFVVNFKRKITVVNDCLTDPKVAVNIREFCRRCGINSSIVLPVAKVEEVFGAFVILSNQRDIFNDGVQELVLEVADVTTFALAKIANDEQKRLAELELSRNEERLRLGLNVTRTGMFEINFHTNTVILDEVSRNLYGIDSSVVEYPSDQFFQLLPKQLQTMIEQAMDKLSAQNEPMDTFSIDERLQCSVNGCRWLRIYGAITTELTEAGEPIRLLGFISDITDQKEQEDREYLAATVFAKSNECILILDENSKIIMANQAFSDTYGYDVDEVMGSTSEIFQSSHHDEQFYQEIQRSVLNSGSWQGEWWRKYKGGDEHPVLAVISAVKDSTGIITHQVIQEMDISDQKEAEQRISNLAYHDSLTNLPNRTLLRDRVEQAIAVGERDGQTLALLFLDLDHFKNINDSLGHDVGDLLLQEVARRLQRSMRRSDTVGRLGGDEFMMLLPDAHSDDAALVAEKVLEECSQAYVLNNHTLAVTPSIGIAMYPRDGTDYDELLKKADTAMYRAKDGGRNGFRFFTPEMNQAVFERMILESRLREAVENDEFELVYQPKYCIDAKQLVGVEALLRWKQPEMGLVSPAKFIPVAEDSGLIVEIGQWVLEEVCRQIKLWQDKGLPLIRVSVNFSPRQFASRDIEKRIFGALDVEGVPGQCLEVEITESLLAQDTDYTLQSLNALKRRGIDISVDDFGTGYSSLSYLKRFPIDRLKIDQSFVRDLERDADDRAIASAVITMGHSLGIQVLAEGVENGQQLTILNDMQCDEVQGYYLGRPMIADDITQTLSSYHSSKIGRREAS